MKVTVTAINEKNELDVTVFPSVLTLSIHSTRSQIEMKEAMEGAISKAEEANAGFVTVESVPPPETHGKHGPYDIGDELIHKNGLRGKVKAVEFRGDLDPEGWYVAIDTEDGALTAPAVEFTAAN